MNRFPPSIRPQQGLEPLYQPVFGKGSHWPIRKLAATQQRKTWKHRKK